MPVVKLLTEFLVLGKERLLLDELLPDPGDRLRQDVGDQLQEPGYALQLLIRVDLDVHAHRAYDPPGVSVSERI